MGQSIESLIAAHEQDLRDLDLQWKHHLRKKEIAWENRLETVASEQKNAELRRELEKVQKENKAFNEEIDIFKGLWGCLADKVTEQVSSLSSSQGGHERECAVCFCTTSQAAISGHSLGVFYCQRGCTNILCGGCIGDRAFNRRCMYCRTSILQGPSHSTEL